MLISETTGDVELFAGVEHAAEAGGPLAVYLEAARGAFSHNTERALRADVEIFGSWCRRHVRAALPASAATVVAFIDDMARVKAPATVRRYVSSIATLHKALRETNPLESAVVKLALQRMHRRRGRRRRAVVSFGAEGRHGAGDTRPGPGAAHLQEDGAPRRASRRHRRRPGRAQHARRAGSGYDRLRHRVAGHPAVRPVEDDAHGPPLRGTVAGPAQRRGPTG